MSRRPVGTSRPVVVALAVECDVKRRDSPELRQNGGRVARVNILVNNAQEVPMGRLIRLTKKRSRQAGIRNRWQPSD
jgi:hypothetical protein